MVGSIFEAHDAHRQPQKDVLDKVAAPMDFEHDIASNAADTLPAQTADYTSNATGPVTSQSTDSDKSISQENTKNASGYVTHDGFAATFGTGSISSERNVNYTPQQDASAGFNGSDSGFDFASPVSGTRFPNLATAS
jgi:hypothetical protein